MKLSPDALKINPAEVSEEKQALIREKVKELSRSGAIIGLSGGLDSAVVAYLCKTALGKEKVLALIMPEKDSTKQNISDAVEVASQLGINSEVKDLTTTLKDFDIYKSPIGYIPTRHLRQFAVKKTFEHFKKTGESPFLQGLLGTDDRLLAAANAYYRIKHRLRMVALYYYAELRNLLVIGAANKTEYNTGFFVKYGCDHAVDLMPIQDLYKTQVKQLAEYLKIPQKIIAKIPTPDLIPGITDEYALGIKYQILDLILLGLENKMSEQEIVSQLNIDQQTVKYVIELKKRSEHMRLK